MLEHMSTDKTSIVVAGAGIGGLASALTLHAAGFEVVVLESAREVKPLGVGINMLPHAVGVLTELGLGERLTRMGIATTEIRFCDKHGTVLFTEPRAWQATTRTRRSRCTADDCNSCCSMRCGNALAHRQFEQLAGFSASRATRPVCGCARLPGTSKRPSWWAPMA